MTLYHSHYTLELFFSGGGMIIYFVYFSLDIFSLFYLTVFIFIHFFKIYIYIYIYIFFFFFVFYIYLCILSFHNFQISVNSLQQSSFIISNSHYTFFFGLISRVGWFFAFGDSVSALTVIDVTEILQLAGFMGRLYTRGTRENRDRRRIDWLSSGYYMYTQDLQFLEELCATCIRLPITYQG